MNNNSVTSSEIERIVNQYSDMLYKIVIHQVPNKADAEDIVQNVFLKIIKNYPIFKSLEHEKAWLIRVSINQCKDLCRTAWYKKIVPLFNEKQVTQDIPEDNIISVIRTLPLNHRNAIYLYYYEEMSIAEIAQILSIKEGTVMSWLHRGRAKLKTILKGEF